MNRFIQTTRSALSHQPVQYLIIDIGYSMNSLILESCITALHTVLSLACSIRGSNRIPGFGLSVIGTSSKCIFPVDIVKGNFRKFEEALNSIYDSIKIGDQTEKFDDLLFQSLLTALNDFKSKSDTAVGSNIWPFSSQLQINILTTKPGLAMQDCLEQAIQNMPTTRLKKIMVVELKPSLSDIPETKCCQAFDLSRTLGFVEVAQTLATEDNMEDFFKQWLLDYNKDTEHLRIIFPNENSNNHINNQNFILKCDISECIINPNTLPFGHRFTIQMDSSAFHLGSMSGKSLGANLAIYELFVVARLSSGGVCESLLFGQPLRLSPTQCWRIEWTKRMSNQQSFMALCEDLETKDELLLAQLKSNFNSENVSGYFILVPGEMSFLLKAVAARELILPKINIKADRGCTIGRVPADFSKIISTLENLPFLPEYDPLIWQSNLCSSLVKNLQNNSHSIGVQDIDTKENTKKKTPIQNMIVTTAINRISKQHGRSLKRAHTLNYKRIKSLTET